MNRSKTLILKQITFSFLRTINKSPVFFLIDIFSFFYLLLSLEKKKGVGCLLVLNRSRFPNDLLAFEQFTGIRMLYLSETVQCFINALYLGKKKSYSIDDYDSPSIGASRLLFLIRSLYKVLFWVYGKIDVLTCSFYYRQDFPYAVASKGSKQCDFYVLFKEYMKDASLYYSALNFYRQNKFRFVGRKLFAANTRLKKLLIESEVCNERQVEVVGSPRFDLVYHRDRRVAKSKMKTGLKQKAVLFSFFHSSGLVRLKGSNQFFTTDPNDGFYHLFEEVHAGFALAAKEAAEHQFIIKTKWLGPWKAQIVKVIQEATGMAVAEMKNLKIVDDIPAQNLIKEAKVVVAFNSTTILETLLYQKRMIIPLFAEAKDKYYDSNILFRAYLHKFNTVSGKKNLIQKILEQLELPDVRCQIPPGMIEEYLYKHDGNVSKRIELVINAGKSNYLERAF